MWQMPEHRTGEARPTGKARPSRMTGDAQPSPMAGSEGGRGGGWAMGVVVAEDAPWFREGLARLITDRGHEVAAAVGDADALLEAVAEHDPDVAVVDIRMPPTHTDEGLRAAIELRREHPGTGVLVLSQYIETRYAARLLAGHAAGVGYLLQDTLRGAA